MHGLAPCELIQAGRAVYDEMFNLIVGVKSNGDHGVFYRNQHQLIGVFRVATSPHRDDEKFARPGRSRSNVWEVPGAVSFLAGRLDERKDYPQIQLR